MGVCDGGPKGCTAVDGVPESALASLEVVLKKSSEGQGVCRVWSTSLHALGGVLGSLGAHFASFFRFRFLYRFFIVFLSILEGFWEGFGGQNRRKIDIFGVFLNMFYETLIFLKNS